MKSSLILTLTESFACTNSKLTMSRPATPGENQANLPTLPELHVAAQYGDIGKIHELLSSGVASIHERDAQNIVGPTCLYIKLS